MRSGFRDCYRRALAREARLQGRVVIEMKVVSSGEILTATASGDGLPAEQLECMLDVVGAHRFPPPEGGSAVVRVPVRFVPEEPR